MATFSAEIERYRDYLSLLARLQIGRRFQARFDASDVVQQTLMEAYLGNEQFRGSVPEQRAAWLRKILARNIANAVRDHRRERRDIDRDVSIQQSLAESSLRLGDLLAAEQSTPSQQAMRCERSLELAHALLRLPENQREVVILRHFHEESLPAIGEQLELTKHEVAKLLRIAVEALRQQLEGHDSSD